MEVSSASWLVIVLAILAANLPFFNDKVFAVVPLKRHPGDPRTVRRKPFWLRLVEMVVLYFAVGAAGFALEARIGTPFPQTWEFYAITACLFIVLAFPGFVVRYLRKHHT
ncbi:DUF2818 family protein [Duganella sp. FT3S]|uniref:DUF2818 family protein n=1 Tax=Rugamonas fusca TaxID=2758568 RepID=A0A7W2I5P7_9BURK|nr:DUF2818 family protein [Rugamonas fusca]MBA5604622.1 DUF2818 family protein [Rugamonas fusca]